MSLPRRYWQPVKQWQAEWLLTDKKAAFREFVARHLGHDRVMQELKEIEIDRVGEYILFQIPVTQEPNAFTILQITSASKGEITLVRTPPQILSIEEAIASSNPWIKFKF